MGKLHVTQLRSANGASRRQRETLRSLGLGRIGQSVDREDTPQLRGMIDAVGHLVRVSDREGGES
jgi:large subunit ribosomal protein L30